MTTIEIAIESLKSKVRWREAGGLARRWCVAFETDFEDRPDVVYGFLRRLAKRRVTMSEFLLCFLASDSDDIRENLKVLDKALLRAGDRRPLTVEDFES